MSTQSAPVRGDRIPEQNRASFAERIRRDHLLWVVCALGPVLVLFTIIRIYPILETVRLSFYRYHPTQRNRPFVGLENYRRLLEDEAFQTALLNTLQFATLAVIVTLTLAFAIAVLLSSIEKTAPIFELLLYVPVVTPWVPASVIWKLIFDPIHGILNYVLGLFGVGTIGWLQDEHVIIYAIVIVAVWKMLGYFVVVFGVGLRNIPDELLEAAEIDGATAWQKLIYIIIPLMKPLILFTVIIATIIFFNVFAPVYVLTASAQGAPAYDLKVVISEIYQNAFVFYRMGYAGAQSVVLLAFVLTLVSLQFFLFRQKR
jgi:multiple sugar transport system permease protein